MCLPGGWLFLVSPLFLLFRVGDFFPVPPPAYTLAPSCYGPFNLGFGVNFGIHLFSEFLLPQSLSPITTIFFLYCPGPSHINSDDPYVRGLPSAITFVVSTFFFLPPSWTVYPLKFPVLATDYWPISRNSKRGVYLFISSFCCLEINTAGARCGRWTYFPLFDILEFHGVKYSLFPASPLKGVTQTP